MAHFNEKKQLTSASTQQLEILVDELMKDDPNKNIVRELCKKLKIPYTLNTTDQIGTVFNKLQSLKPQVINK